MILGHPVPALLLAALMMAGPAAPPPPHRALATGFEPDPALPSELPAGFFRVLTRDSGREGFPPFGRVGATDARSSEGRWGLEFRLAGGALAVVTEPSLVPSAPGEIFESSVSVLIDGLDRSRAVLAIRALDAAGRPIDGAAWRSMAPVVRGWQRLALRAGPMPDGTRAIEVGLEVRPADPRDESGDVAGSVVFDDLELWRRPRVRIEIDRDGAPIGEAPRAAIVTVIDPVPPSETVLRLVDEDGAILGTWSIDGAGEFEVPMPALAPGSYALEAAIDEGGRGLLRERRLVAVADRPGPRVPREDALIRFGVVVDRPSTAHGEELLGSLRLLRPDFVSIDLGDGAVEAPGLLSISRLRRWCDELRLEGIEPILRFSRVPAAAAAAIRVEPDDPAGVLERDDGAWRRVYGEWFERFGHVQPRWMIRAAPERTPSIAQAVRDLVPGFIECDRSIEVIDAPARCDRSSADAAARAAIDRWRGGSRMLALRGAIDEEPAAAALAWSALGAASRGAVSIADLDAGSDLGCLLLSCDRSARVLAWRRDGGSPSHAVLPFDGEAMFAVDALGAPVPIERRGGAMVAEVGSTPIVIDGVDPTLGAFLAAIRFEPARLQGTTAEQDIALRLANPWDVTWEGTVRFVAPVDWSFVPRFQRFTLAPGASATVAARVALPRSEMTGARRVGVELEFTADRGRSIRVDPPIEIRVDEFTCEAQLRPVTLADGRRGAVIEVLLRNRSDRALELETTVSTTSGTARRDGPVRLEAGASARRTVRLDEAPGGAVIVSVGESNGPLRLVRTLR